MLGCAEGVSILGTLVVAAVERLSKWALKTGQYDVRAMHMARCKPQASPQVALLLWCPFDCPACQPTYPARYSHELFKVKFGATERGGHSANHSLRSTFFWCGVSGGTVCQGLLGVGRPRSV